MQEILYPKQFEAAREIVKPATSKEVNGLKDESTRRPYFIPLNILNLKRKRASKQMRKQWKDPLCRNKLSLAISERNRIRWKNPRYRKFMTDILKKNWKNPITRKIMTTNVKQQWQDSTYRNRMVDKGRITLNRQWQNLDYRKMRIKATKDQWKNPIFRQKISKLSSITFRNNWRNPKLRKIMTETTRIQWQNPDFRKIVIASARKHMVITSRRNWRNPEFRRFMSEIRLNQLKQSRKGPNGFEKRVQAFLDSSSRIKFKYVGSGPEAILINGYSPDFINRRKKIIVQANGVYWHLGLYSIEVNKKNKKEHERIKAAPFKDVGYRVIQIWDDEFNRGDYKNGNIF